MLEVKPLGNKYRKYVKTKLSSKSTFLVYNGLWVYHLGYAICHDEKTMKDTFEAGNWELR